MRYLVSPDFVSKVSQSQPDAMSAVSGFVQFVSSSSRDQIISDARVNRLLSEASDILVFKSSGYRLLFTFGTNADGEYLLILDIISELGPSYSESRQRGRLFAKKDPKTNGSVNPFFNGAINPRLNRSLNPTFNSQINPNFNSQLNPRFNSQINPRFNSSINPMFNSRINPRFNSAINPKFNSTINPLRNSLMGGPFVYDLQTNQLGFLVKANEQASLVFDLDAELQMIAISHPKGYAVFDEGGEWKENWIHDGRGGYLRFGTDNEWLGFVV